jgi:hypothetical protein
MARMHAGAPRAEQGGQEASVPADRLPEAVAGGAGGGDIQRPDAAAHHRAAALRRAGEDHRRRRCQPWGHRRGARPGLHGRHVQNGDENQGGQTSAVVCRPQVRSAPDERRPRPGGGRRNGHDEITVRVYNDSRAGSGEEGEGEQDEEQTVIEWPVRA